MIWGKKGSVLFLFPRPVQKAFFCATQTPHMIISRVQQSPFLWPVPYLLGWGWGGWLSHEQQPLLLHHGVLYHQPSPHILLHALLRIMQLLCDTLKLIKQAKSLAILSITGREEGRRVLQSRVGAGLWSPIYPIATYTRASKSLAKGSKAIWSTVCIWDTLPSSMKNGSHFTYGKSRPD